jgi:hypothetical protein
MRIDSSGNVGIGTSSPAGKLQINAQDGFIFNAASSISTMRFGSAVTGEGTAELAYARTDGSVRISTGATGGALNERMRIDNAGNVGIGTSSPGARFGVIESGGVPNAISLLCSPDNSTANWRHQLDNDNYTGRLRIRDASNIENVRLTAFGNSYINGGNVGIGTSSPARPLHVSDVMRLEPRNGAPSSPAKGDIYFDSADDKLKCYDGSVWQDLF